MAHEASDHQVAPEQAKAGWGLRWQKRQAATTEVNGMALTPEAWSLLVRWPSGGVVWNHPAALRVERAGQSERLVIGDVTLVTQIALLAVTGVALVLAGLWYSAKRPKRR